MVIGVSEAGPEPSILSLTALSLLELHSWSAEAKVVASFGRGTALGSSALGQQGQQCLPAIYDKTDDTCTARRSSKFAL